MTKPKLRKPSTIPELDLPYMPYFTHEALINDWPPGWLPSDDWGKSSVQASSIASANREVQVQAGNLGTISDLSVKSNARLRDVPTAPGWIRGQE